MAKNKFPMKRQPTGSLAGRVLVICLSLLVLPLVLDTLFLYRQEYREWLSEAKQILQMIGEGERAFLEEKIEMNWKILDAIGDDAATYAKKFQVVVIQVPATVEDHFVIPSARNEALLIGKKRTQQTAFAIKISYQEILGQFTQFEKAPYPVSLALVDDQNKVFAGEVMADALSLKLPIKEGQISLLLSTSVKEIRTVYEREALFRFLSLLLSIVLIGGGLVWLLTKRVAKPLKHLNQVMYRVKEGAVHIRYIPDRMGFEINELGEQFNETLDAMLHQQQEAAKERIGREKLAEELRIGHEIQAGLFPTHIPEITELDIATGYLPAREVGGDFYDIFLLENGSIFIAIADTAGKGISACLYSLGLRSSLRSFVAYSTDLSEIILRANDLFWVDAKNTGMFVTLWAALYDPKQRRLTYCNQGHAPAFLIREGKIEELTTTGIAMGAQKLETVNTKTLSLQEEDLLFLYTDGVIEANDPDHQLFGSKRLREFLSRNKKKTPQQIIDHLLEEVHLFGQGMPQHDDLTTVVFRISN